MVPFPADSFSPDALGRVVQRLRKQQGLKQEELGERAGYKSGPAAGVSISRLENGRLERPGEQRLTKLANALGLSLEELVDAAATETEKPEGPTLASQLSIKDRLGRIQRAVDSRKKLLADLEESFDRADEQAAESYLHRLREIAECLDIEMADDPPRVFDDSQPDSKGAELEAAYTMGLTRYGVAQALAGTARRKPVASTDDDAASVTFAVALAAGVAAAASAIPDNPAANAGMLTALRAVGLPTRRVPSVGRNASLAALGVAVVTAAVVGLWEVTRSRKEQRELKAKLAEVEKQISDTQADLEALQRLMTKATKLLEYIAIHAGHALRRWYEQLDRASGKRQTLGASDKQRYQEFVDVAAAQITISSINFENLLPGRGADLERERAVAEEILNQSEAVITAYV